MASRRESQEGHYDIHSNTVQWPRTMQPTHARWETVEPGETGRRRAEQNSELLDENNSAEGDVDQELSSLFKQLDPVYPRNFMIHDLYLEGAPESKFGPPGLDNDPQSLSSIPHDVLDDLPPNCRQAFKEAKKRELLWRSQWSTESVDGKRGKFMPTVEWFP
jgi:chromatin structure-remodeling complex protein RSC7